MADNLKSNPRKILIVSSHPLFGKGMRHLLETHQGEQAEVIGIVTNIKDAMHFLSERKPDLVVVDYDDDAVNRDEFMARFMESEHQLRIVLLSLKEGGSNAIVYDRRNLEASQIDDWLRDWAVLPSKSQEGRKIRQSISKSGKGNMKTNYKHYIGVMVFVIILTILGLFVLQNKYLLPIAASDQAIPIDRLFSLEFKAMAVLFGVIVGAVIYSVIFFRRKPGDLDDPVYQKSDQSLNINWVVFPVGALTVFVILNVSPAFEKLFNRIVPNGGISFDWAASILSIGSGAILYFVLFGIGSAKSSPDENVKENKKLEIAWITMPLLLVLLLSFAGSDALAQTLRRDPQPLVVNVTAQQWSWRFEYPDQNIVSEELVLPLNKQVLLKLTAVDVIHSFWVPEFRVKQDLVPGEEKELRITPNKEGTFTVMCAEICGTQHAYMNAPVTIKSTSDFETWLSALQSPTSINPVERGLSDYTKYGCKSCHSIDGKAGVGPTLKGLYGKQETMSDGTKITVDENYLIEAIREPDKHIVYGFSNIMPEGAGENMTNEQINDIIEFIKTLK